MEALGDQRLPVEVRFPSGTAPRICLQQSDHRPRGREHIRQGSEVARVKHVILTLPSRMNGKSIDDSFPVTALDASGAVVTGVRLDANEVRLKLSLVEVPAAKRVIVSPDIAGSPAVPGKVTKVDAEPSLVTLQGKPAVLAAIRPSTPNPINIDGVNNYNQLRGWSEAAAGREHHGRKQSACDGAHFAAGRIVIGRKL